MADGRLGRIQRARERAANAPPPPATPDEQIATITREQFARFQEAYLPIIQDNIASLGQSTVEQSRQDAITANTTAASVADRRIARFGAPVSPEKRAAIARRRRLSGTANIVSQTNQARVSDLDRDTRLGQDLVATGRGISRQGQSGLGKVAELAAGREALFGQQKQQARAQNAQTVASIASIALMFAASSKELKHDIQVFSDAEALGLVTEIELVSFKYNADMGLDGDFIGAIAEDVPEIFANKERTMLNTYNLVGALVGSVQALSKRVKELEAGDGTR